MKTARGAADQSQQGQLSLQLESPAPTPLAPGDQLPEFRLLDAQGQTVTREQLVGQPLVLYFYPKDDTPGCTKEACGFRDEMSRITEAGAQVVGVSPDKPATHARFIEKYQLNFRLLSDPVHELARQFGVYKLKKNYGREYMGIERSTFLFDAQGVLQRQWRAVKVAGHVAEVIAELEAS